MISGTELATLHQSHNVTHRTHSTTVHTTNHYIHSTRHTHCKSTEHLTAPNTHCVQNNFYIPHGALYTLHSPVHCKPLAHSMHCTHHCDRYTVCTQLLLIHTVYPTAPTLHNTCHICMLLHYNIAHTRHTKAYHIMAHTAQHYAYCTHYTHIVHTAQFCRLACSKHTEETVHRCTHIP